MLSSVGIEMGLAIFIGYLIGDYLDGRFDTFPYLTLFFLLIGIGAAFRGLIRAANRARR
ncbi:MAG: AtpZ/AtpI family protein [Deltaproteobacteria bacterium]|nr:AtpZ/AtpI family protein [Deltaproteobacteria bacterium]